MAYQGPRHPKQGYPEGTSQPNNPRTVSRMDTNVSITFDLPAEAAKTLSQLAESQDIALRQLGIISLQLQGGKLLTLSLAGSQSNGEESDSSKIPEENSISVNAIPKTEPVLASGFLKRPANSGIPSTRPGFHQSTSSLLESPDKKRRKHEVSGPSPELPPMFPAGAFPSPVSSLTLNNGYPTDNFQRGPAFLNKCASEPNTHFNLISRMNKTKANETLVKPSLSISSSGDLITTTLMQNDVPKRKPLRLNPNTGLLEPGFSGGDSSSDGEIDQELHNKSIKFSSDLAKRGYSKVGSKRPRENEVGGSTMMPSGDAALKLKLKLPHVSSNRATGKRPTGESQFELNHKNVEPKLPKLIFSMRDKTVKVAAGTRTEKSEISADQGDADLDDDEEFDSIKLKTPANQKSARTTTTITTATTVTTENCDKSKHLDFITDTSKFTSVETRTSNTSFKGSPTDHWSAMGIKCNDEINLRLSDKPNLPKSPSDTKTIESSLKVEGAQLIVNEKSPDVISEVDTAKTDIESRLEFKPVLKPDTSRVEEHFSLPSRDTDSHAHQGDDSGIESMDTLSEKSPNQGETPGDDKIERELKELESNSALTVQHPHQAPPSSPSNSSLGDIDSNVKSQVLNLDSVKIEPVTVITEDPPPSTSVSDNSTINNCKSEPSSQVTLNSTEDSVVTVKQEASTDSSPAQNTDVKCSNNSTTQSSSLSIISVDMKSVTPPLETVSSDSKVQQDTIVPVQASKFEHSLIGSEITSGFPLSNETLSKPLDPIKAETVMTPVVTPVMAPVVTHSIIHQSSALPTNTVHINGRLSPMPPVGGGQIQVRSTGMVPTGAKMVPVKVVSVSNAGAVRLLRVSPVKTASQSPMNITSRAVVIKSSMLRAVAPKEVSNPGLLPSHLAASQPLSPSLLNNVKDSGPPPAMYNIIRTSAINTQSTPSLVMHTNSIGNQPISNDKILSGEPFTLSQELKDKIQAATSSSVVTTTTISPSLSITPVWNPSSGNPMSTQQNLTFQDVVESMAKNRAVLDSKLVVTKMVDEKSFDDGKTKARARPQKKVENSDFGGSLLRPLLQKEDPVDESTKSKPRLKPDEETSANPDEPQTTSTEILTVSENATNEVLLIQDVVKDSVIIIGDEDQPLEKETNLKKPGKSEMPSLSVVKTKVSVELGPTTQILSLEEAKERRSVRQQMPTAALLQAAKMAPVKTTTTPIKNISQLGKQKLNSVETIVDVESEWASKPKRVTSAGPTMTGTGNPGLGGSTSTLNNSCNVVVEANKNLSAVKRIKTRSAKTTDDKIEGKQSRRLKMDSL